MAEWLTQHSVWEAQVVKKFLTIYGAWKFITVVLKTTTTITFSETFEPIVYSETLFKIRFNIIFPYKLLSYQVIFPFRISD